MTAHTGIYTYGDTLSLHGALPICAGWSALLASTLFMACSALAFWFAGRFLVGLFLDPAMPENAPVIDLAVTFLAIAALFQLVDGGQVIGVPVLRGLTATAVPPRLQLAGHWGVGTVWGTVV